MLRQLRKNLQVLFGRHLWHEQDEQQRNRLAVGGVKRYRCRQAEESTGGGTSDARFIAPLGAQCIEVGPVNASIHQVDEHVRVADLQALPALYRQLIERLLA